MMIIILNLVLRPFLPALIAAGFDKAAPQPLNEPALAEAADTAAAEAAEAVDQATLVAGKLPEHCSALLSMPPFLYKVVLRGQHPQVAVRLCAAACVARRDMSVKLIGLLVPALGDVVFAVTVVEVLVSLLELRDGDQLQSERADVLLGGEGGEGGLLLAARHAASKKLDMRCVCLIGALHALSARSPTATEWLKMRRLDWEWMCSWLRNHDAGQLWSVHADNPQVCVDGCSEAQPICPYEALRHRGLRRRIKPVYRGFITSLRNALQSSALGDSEHFESLRRALDCAHTKQALLPSKAFQSCDG